MSKPLILADNLLETVVLHPTAVVRVDNAPSGYGGDLPDVAGAEPYRLSDNLRDITHFTTGRAGEVTNVAVNSGGAQRVDTLVLDRGHNLPAGTTLRVQAAPEGASWYGVRELTVPSAIGGDPRTGLRRTPEGVLWTTAMPPDVYDNQSTPLGRPWWRVQFDALPNGAPPVLSSLALGLAYQCPEYWDGPSSLDYRLNIKVMKNAMSDAGIRIKRHIRPFAELQLQATLEEEDYAQLNPLIWRLLAQGHPWWVCVDMDASAPLRLFQAPEGGVFDPTGLVNRSVNLLLEEVAPLLTV